MHFSNTASIYLNLSPAMAHYVGSSNSHFQFQKSPVNMDLLLGEGLMLRAQSF